MCAEQVESVDDQEISLYDIIGVEPTATDEEIKRAYRKKAMLLHPDRNKDDPMATQKFQQLSEAYEILKDPVKRQKYDTFGKGGEMPQTPEDMELFEMMTQIIGLGRSRAVPKGDKVSPTLRLLKVPLKTIFTGGKVQTTVKYHKICPKCKGVGSNNGVSYPVCPVCNGSGSLSPILQFLFPCKNCDSTGYLIPPEWRCTECRGRRLIKARKTVSVDIEIGIQSEEQIVLPDQGDEFPGKKPADLIFLIQEKKDSDFVRDGDDLYFIKKLPIIEQKQGAAFTIHTFDGRELEVYTEKDKPVDLTRLKWIPNEGMPCRGNVQLRGNLYIVFEKGFPEPIHEAYRTIKSLFNRYYGSKILLQDAPEDKQQQYQELLRQQEEAYEEMMREFKEQKEAAKEEAAQIKAQKAQRKAAEKEQRNAEATAYLSGN